MVRKFEQNRRFSGNFCLYEPPSPEAHFVIIYSTNNNKIYYGPINICMLFAIGTSRIVFAKKANLKPQKRNKYASDLGWFARLKMDYRAGHCEHCRNSNVTVKDIKST